MSTLKRYNGTNWENVGNSSLPKTTKANSDTDTYSCNYINNLVKTVEVYNAVRGLSTVNGDVNNVITVDAVDGTVLMYFITEAWPLENWNNGALVEIGRMFPQENKIMLKASSSEQYVLKINALYIPN